MTRHAFIGTNPELNDARGTACFSLRLFRLDDVHSTIDEQLHFSYEAGIVRSEEYSNLADVGPRRSDQAAPCWSHIEEPPYCWRGLQLPYGSVPG
jgi:hypothetical protein